jgi:hypothetical protein
MSKKVIFISLFFLVIVLGGVSFVIIKKFESIPKYRIVNISGSGMTWNLSRSSSLFIPYGIKEENLALPAADGDFLYCVLYDGADFFLRYRDSDGLHYSFSEDSTGIIKNNEKIFSLQIYEGSNICEWIENNGISAFKDLRSIHIMGDVGDSNLECLERISEIKPDPGIYIESGDPVFLKRIFSSFDPSWLYFLEYIEEEAALDEILSNINNLELLILDGTNKLDFLYHIPGLNSLIIFFLDPQVNKDFTFVKINNLRSLSILLSDIEDLACIGEITKLQSLNLDLCGSLTDISSVKNFPRLKSLSITGCEEISDITLINSISSLTWISFPPNINQETFANIVDQHPSLQVIELVECEGINDLSPLEGLNNIKAITLDVSATDYTPLYHLKTLEYILFPEDIFEENKQEISYLQEALPNAQIVPGGGGFCLGSGWILLLFPMIMISVTIRGYLLKSGD